MSLIVAGNWKMFASRDQVTTFVGELTELWQAGGPQGGVGPIAGVEALIFPPTGYLAQLGAELDHKLTACVELGGQSCYPADDGAFTGETAPAMLRDLGATWVLAGHSERRTLFGESNEFVAQQVAAALKLGLAPILCVGESLEQRDAGAAEDCVITQVDAVLAALGEAAFAQVTLAYEPIWAIGTGRTATPEQAQDMHGVLRARLARADQGLAQRVKILYGGSVKPDNAAQLFAQPDIDGGLVGGASLAASSFWQLIEAARAVVSRGK